ncbi:MAG: hypothetical protein OXE81_09825 [Gammaproteobacteria bacterium]|nr:hypothetical protein [Gammaproteobacteria bacterium]
MKLLRFLICAGLLWALPLLATAHDECPDPLPITSGPNGIFYWNTDDQEIEGPRPSKPAPVWMIWQSLYQWFDIHGSMLQRRASLTDDEVQLLLYEGEAYLDAIEQIDEQAYTEMNERYGPEFPYEYYSIDIGMPPGSITEPYVPPYARDGRPLRVAMAEDGFNDEIDARKYAAYRTHWDALAESIGLYSLLSVESYVERELSVNLTVLPPDVSVTELPPMLQEFVEFLKNRPIEEVVR